MREETKRWLEYAAENLQVSKICLKSGLFNACLQNTQQCVEKNLKALFLDFALKLIRTHNIEKLISELKQKGISVNVSTEDQELLDSIYTPSKYPLSSSLPDFEPDSDICHRCISVAEAVECSVNQVISGREKQQGGKDY